MNGPFSTHHTNIRGAIWELDAHGQPTQKIIESRRQVSFITPIPNLRQRGGWAEQQQIIFNEGVGLSTEKQPVELQTAIEALYGHYEKTFALWSGAGIRVPPCFIVVCNNTSASKLVYDYISGFTRKNEDDDKTS